MAKGGGRRRTYIRDSRGRFASTPGGAAKKAAKSTSGRKGTLGARTGLKGSRAKLKARDKADQTLQTALSTRAQKAAVTRGSRKLAAAKVAARARIGGGRKGVIGKPKGLKPSKVTKTSKSVKKALTGSDLVKKFDRLMTKQFQGVYQNENSPLKRERALIQETNPQKRAVLQRKLDKARETQARAIGFRDTLAEAKGLQYPGKSKTAEGQSIMLKNYKNRPRYSTKQKVKPAWNKNFIR